MISKLRRQLKRYAIKEEQFLNKLDQNVRINRYNPDFLSITYAEVLRIPIDMAKDFRDTFRPYKNEHQVRRDKFQLFKGISNIVRGFGLAFKGFFEFISTIVALLTLTIMLPLVPLSYLFSGAKTILKDACKFFFISAYFSLAASLAAPLLLLRGVTQVVTAPLALLRIKFKKYIFSEVPYKKLIEKPKFNLNLDQVAELIASDHDIYQSEEMLDALDRVFYKDKDTQKIVDNEILEKRQIANRWTEIQNDQIITYTQYKLDIDKLSTPARIRLFINQKYDKNNMKVNCLHAQTIKDYIKSFDPELDYAFNQSDRIAIASLRNICEKYPDYQGQSFENNRIYPKQLKHDRKQLMLFTHPDKGGTKEDFSKVQNAFDTLRKSQMN